MTSSRQHLARLIFALSLVSLVSLPTSSSASPLKVRDPGGAGGQNSAVFPPGSSPYGKTYGEWSAEQWKWTMAIPSPINPTNDLTGANGSLGQSGKVWFLAGTSCPFNTNCGNLNVTRNLTIPSGTSLFFPLIAVECSTGEGNGTTDAQLRACAVSFTDVAINLSCEIDGDPIQNVNQYRVQSPLFEFTYPADNIFNIPSPPFSTQSVSDGVWIMAKPLSVGQHTIHFTGGIDPQVFEFGFSITYHLTVVPAGHFATQSDGTEFRAAGVAAAPAARHTSWGHLKSIYR